MGLKSIKNPKLSVKKTGEIDFLSLTAFSKNVKIDKKLTLASKSVDVCDFSCKIVKLYNKNGKIYAYTDTQKILCYDGQNITTVMQGVKDIPIIESVVVEGQNKTLIVTKTEAYIDGQNFNIPFGKYAQVYQGRIFTANEKTISFGAQFDFTTFSVSGLVGTFTVEQQDGEIKGIATLSDGLYIFCESAIYKLYPDEQTVFSLKRLDECVSNVKQGSVQSVGGKIYFYCDTKLMAFNGNSVVETIVDLDKVSSFYGDCTACFGANHLSCLMQNGSTDVKLMMYNTLEKTLEFCAHNVQCVADGGYYCDGEGKVFLLKSEEKTDKQAFWRSKKLDLWQTGKKTIVGVSLVSNGEVTLLLEGQSAKRTLHFSGGRLCLKTHCTSNDFTITLTGQGSAFNVCNLKLKYIVAGE